MSELTLAHTIINQIQANISKLGVHKVKKVVLNLDQAIKSDQLKKEIMNVSTHTSFKDAVWVVREMKKRGKCSVCHSLFEFPFQEMQPQCPFCNSKRIEKIERQKYQIVGFEF